MYQNKYFKYKTKYLSLKNQVVPLYNLIKRGGSAEFDTLASQCLSQIKDGDNTCVSCKFFHLNDKSSGSHTKKMCAPQDVPVYFFKNGEDNIDLFNKFLGKPLISIDELQLFEINSFDPIENVDTISQSFLNPAQYRNVCSYTVISDPILGNIITIKEFNQDVSTFCAEGNIVWVNSNSKVGTTGITSCLFVIIFLDDYSKLCIHHTIGDNLDTGIDSGWGPQKNYTHKNYLRQILEQVKGKIVKIYTLGLSLEKYYPNLKEIYSQYSTITPIGVEGHYIITNNNLLILKTIP
jgi:hypothetical protein